MKITIKNIIKENKDIDPKQRYINGIVKMIKPPYFRFLIVNEIPRELWNDIFSKLFKQEVIISDNVIYDLNDNRIYYEDSDEFWSKREYDLNDNEIYYETSDGRWLKREFDSNNNRIYYETSNGYWEKFEYDSNNNEIYYENSNGVIIDNRPSNPINENINPKQKYINKISEILNPPYFNFLEVNEVPIELWNEILTKVFNQEVIISDNVIYDLNDNNIYDENSDGYWSKREYDSNDNIIYQENSDGNWVKYEYDSNNNVIYYENSNGYWVKREFDLNNNRIYYEDYEGYWSKREYDENNNIIYYEDSNGTIRDNRPINPINENNDIDFKQVYINGIIKMIRPPYFRFLKVNEIPKELWKDILSNIFNTKVTYSDNRIYDSNSNNIYSEDFNGFWIKREYNENNKKIYYENSNGYWMKREFDSNNNVIYQVDSDGKWIEREFDSNNNIIYYENSDGNWIKREYDSNNNEIYQEDSDGFWEKREFDSNNNIIYYEDSNGNWIKREYDSNNNIIYYEHSDGRWTKREYDSNNNEIYQENSDGDWEKREYDENNKMIYYEDSDGKIMDKRPSNSLNENTDPKQKYINGIINMIRRPYMEFLINNEVPEELWKGILSKIFNTNDIDWEMNPDIDPDIEVRYELIILDEKGRQLYYEVPDYWEQLIYGYHTRLDMDFNWYINSVGSKKVTFVGKHNPIVYSNGPTGHPWSGLSDDIKNNKFFDLNY